MLSENEVQSRHRDHKPSRFIWSIRLSVFLTSTCRVLGDSFIGWDCGKETIMICIMWVTSHLWKPLCWGHWPADTYCVSSLHRGGDPKTGMYVTGSEHTCSTRKTPAQQRNRNHQSISVMWATYIYSESCRCSCFSSELGSRDHTPVRPSHPEGTGEGST